MEVAGESRGSWPAPAWQLPPGLAGCCRVPHRGISQHPPERRRAILFRKPRAPRDAPTPPTSSPVPVVTAAQPGWLSQRRPRVCPQNVSQGRGTSGPRASSMLCPQDPSCHGWATPLHGHGTDAIVEPGQRRRPRDPGCRQPLASPPAAGSFPSEQMGQGSGGSEEESRKGNFLTLHILQVEHFVRFSLACKSISGSALGLDVGACESTAAGGDAAGAGKRGPATQRVTLGGSL